MLDLFRKQETVPSSSSGLALCVLFGSAGHDPDQEEYVDCAFGDHWFQIPPVRLSTVSAGVFVELGKFVTGWNGGLSPDDEDLVTRIWSGLIDAQLDPRETCTDPESLDLDLAVLLFESIKACLPLPPVPFDVTRALFVALDLDVD